MWEPLRLIDADGDPVVPVMSFLKELQAAGRSMGTQRSCAMDLLRWLRFVWAIDVVRSEPYDGEARLECAADIAARGGDVDHRTEPPASLLIDPRRRLVGAQPLGGERQLGVDQRGGPGPGEQVVVDVRQQPHPVAPRQSRQARGDIGPQRPAGQ